jgi:hypothetical protein
LQVTSFTVIRNGLLDHIRAGKLCPGDLGAYTFLHLTADWSTGVCYTCAAGIAAQFGDRDLKESIQKSLRRLRSKGYINYRRGDGQRGCYAISIHKYEPTVGGLCGTRLNAFSGVYEPKNGAGTAPGGVISPENGRDTVSGTVETLWEAEVSSCPATELEGSNCESENSRDTVSETVEAPILDLRLKSKAKPLSEPKSSSDQTRKAKAKAKAKKPHQTDPRFTPTQKRFAHAFFQVAKSDEPPPWDGHCAKELTGWLKSNNLSQCAIDALIANIQGSGNAEQLLRDPARLIPRLRKYNQPLDRYGNPIDGRNGSTNGEAFKLPADYESPSAKLRRQETQTKTREVAAS